MKNRALILGYLAAATLCAVVGACIPDLHHIVLPACIIVTGCILTRNCEEG